MNGLVIVLICVAILAAGYKIYGSWLAKELGIDDKIDTPAHSMADGVDYVAAPAPVLMGHHFSSIAGAGPITGPIGAISLGFGWLACLFWILIGGIFFGGVHDYGSLVASIRHRGGSIGEIISVNMGKRAKRLFIIFAYLTLILAVAAFAAIVATTFAAKFDASGNVILAQSVNQARVAMVSMLFIVIAMIFGYFVYCRHVSMTAATIGGMLGIIAIIVIGLNWHPIYLSHSTWMWVVGAYITIASVTPVWLLLQPRDYLSSFLLYAMLFVAFVGVVVAQPSFSSLPLIEAPDCKSYVFPVLFTTIACGAISGFHSLVSSGTTSKQLDKESDARPIAYGGMLLECVLAVLTLCACAYAYSWNQSHPQALLKGPIAIFGGGIAHMIDDTLPGTFDVLNTLLTLTYSAFCLTSLDTAARLGRFMCQEFWLDASKGETPENVGGVRGFLANPYFATILTVVLSVLLGMNGFAKIWALFGSANQLLAALGLMAVAAWLTNIGKNNKMFVIPACFMMVVTLCSLVLNTKVQWGIIQSGKADWGPCSQVVFGVLLIVLSLELAVEGYRVLFCGKKAQD